MIWVIFKSNRQVSLLYVLPQLFLFCFDLMECNAGKSKKNGKKNVFFVTFAIVFVFQWRRKDYIF